MTAPKIEITDIGVICVDGRCVGMVSTDVAMDAIRAALAELEALRPAPPEPVLVTQLKGRTIDGETEPVADWLAYGTSKVADSWFEANGLGHPLTIDPATATVLCRPLGADA